MKLKNLLESTPGYENRKFGDPLPTLSSVSAAHQANQVNEAPSVISMPEASKVWDELVKTFSDNKNDSIEYLNKDASYRNMAIKAIFRATKF